MSSESKMEILEIDLEKRSTKGHKAKQLPPVVPETQRTLIQIDNSVEYTERYGEKNHLATLRKSK